MMWVADELGRLPAMLIRDGILRLNNLRHKGKNAELIPKGVHS
jgi:hypothetical protein